MRLTSSRTRTRAALLAALGPLSSCFTNFPSLLLVTAKAEDENTAIWELKVNHLVDQAVDDKQPKTIKIKLHKEWSPAGFQRLIDMTTADYFKDLRFFRTIRGFMTQFGISGDPAVSAEWQAKPALPIEDVKKSNQRGYLTFAMDGRKHRTTQLFINLVDNTFLDSQGFAPVGEVIEGMEHVDKLYSEYGEGAPSGDGPRQDLVQTQGNRYLDDKFPLLSHLESASIQLGSGTVSAAPVPKASPPSLQPAMESGNIAPADAKKEQTSTSNSWIPSLWSLLALCFVAGLLFIFRKRLFGDANNRSSYAKSGVGYSPSTGAARTNSARERDFAL
ncbi:unnamed protein product [Amoebophrya sp. A120]|nr:unnamed protein product [Amoebophrya sp. A120]|eukprot:GSA120T00007347001.1